MLPILIAFYALVAAATLLSIWPVGRSGLERRSLQVAAAIGWPAYWLVFKRPRDIAVAAANLILFVVLGTGLVLLLPFLLLERRGLL